MTDDTFSQKIEWKLHKFIIAFNFMICVAALVTKTLNSRPGGKFCSICAVPAGCRQSPDIYGECDKTVARNTTILSYAMNFTLLGCLIGIITCMVKICWHVMITTPHTSTRKRTMRGSSQDERTTTVREIVKNNDADDEECTGHEIEPAQRTLVGSQTYQDECSENDLVKVYRREFVIQASLYVLAYIAQIFFTLYSMIVLVIVKRHLNDVIVLLASIFYPLGGLFNILVYTRPKVLSLRRKNPQYYWFQAFVIVIRAGAVVPMVVVEEENSPSLPRESLVFKNLTSILLDQSSSLQMRYRWVSSVVTLNRTIGIKLRSASTIWWSASTMEILGYWILRLQVLQMHYHRRQMSPATVLQRVRANGQEIYLYFQEWTPSLKNQMKKNSLLIL